jgi:molecular chaperone GrpE
MNNVNQSQNEPSAESHSQAEQGEATTTPSVEDVAKEFQQEQEAEGLQARLDEAEAKVAELNDKLLRAAAEAQNTKRRAEIDIENAQKYSVEKFANDMVSVLDNLYRASESVSEEMAAKDEYLKAIKEGVEITKKEMTNALKRNGIERVVPLNQPFDHNFHQAVAQVPAPDKIPGEVLDVVQAGYTLKGRILRPAMVAVVASTPGNQTVAPEVPQQKPVQSQAGGANHIPDTKEF